MVKRPPFFYALLLFTIGDDMQARLSFRLFCSVAYLLACGGQQQVITSVDSDANASIEVDALVVSFLTKETPRSGGFQTEVRLKLIGAQVDESAIASLQTQCGGPVVEAPNRMMLKCYWAGNGDDFLVEKEGASLVVSHRTYSDGIEAKVIKRIQTIVLVEDYPIEFSTKTD